MVIAKSVFTDNLGQEMADSSANDGGVQVYIRPQSPLIVDNTPVGVTVNQVQQIDTAPPIDDLHASLGMVVKYMVFVGSAGYCPYTVTLSCDEIKNEIQRASNLSKTGLSADKIQTINNWLSDANDLVLNKCTPVVVTTTNAVSTPIVTNTAQAEIKTTAAQAEVLSNVTSGGSNTSSVPREGAPAPAVTPEPPIVSPTLSKNLKPFVLILGVVVGALIIRKLVQ